MRQARPDEDVHRLQKKTSEGRDDPPDAGCGGGTASVWWIRGSWGLCLPRCALLESDFGGGTAAQGFQTRSEGTYSGGPALERVRPLVFRAARLQRYLYDFWGVKWRKSEFMNLQKSST
ncbi:hypothetical protein TRIP_B330472 [uncultured Desulfatiglans sp.]|uniref:Uncharacterized protein n=1 Tax=Uncultured Desulfatiglans sp. TaxID=1748965 RepID=A0A653A8G2_UNCDX|nr:hypothetical protein TRIP_B330472 [uncultured Desulfatiglans sp.]